MSSLPAVRRASNIAPWSRSRPTACVRCLECGTGLGDAAARPRAASWTCTATTPTGARASPKTLGYHDYRADEALVRGHVPAPARICAAERPRRRSGAGCRLRGGLLHAGAARAWLRHIWRRGLTDDRRAMQWSDSASTPCTSARSTAPRSPTESFDLITMWDVIEHVRRSARFAGAGTRPVAPGRACWWSRRRTSTALFARAARAGAGTTTSTRSTSTTSPEPRCACCWTSLGSTSSSSRTAMGASTCRFEFIAERAGRVHPALSAALRPAGDASKSAQDLLQLHGRDGRPRAHREPAEAVEETAYRQFIELERTHFWFVGRRRIFLHLLERELDGRTDLQVLDVGCGAGGMLGPLSRYGAVKGIDTSPDLVEFCHSRGFDRVRGRPRPTSFRSHSGRWT